MERRDLYQDDLTEERYPSPARRNDEAATQVLDPDASADDDPQTADDDDDDDDEDDEDEEDD